MGQKNILIVDDSKFDVDLATKALAQYRENHVIDVARDGDQALDYLYCRGHFSERKSGNPVLILLDLNMPKIGGIEVLKQIRTDPLLRRIAVVVFTSSREDRDVIESYEYGANAYLVKPVEFEKYREMVQQVGTFWLQINEAPPH